MSKIDISEEIGDFLRLLDQAQKDYAWYKDELHRLEQLQQDYLHMLELQDATYHKRAKIASELRQCRIDCREAKDTIAILDPMVDFLQSDSENSYHSKLKPAPDNSRITACRFSAISFLAF